jgi:hypothetical protein
VRRFEIRVGGPPEVVIQIELCSPLRSRRAERDNGVAGSMLGTCLGSDLWKMAKPFGLPNVVLKQLLTSLAA